MDALAVGSNLAQGTVFHRNCNDRAATVDGMPGFSQVPFAAVTNLSHSRRLRRTGGRRGYSKSRNREQNQSCH
jgi:hypothetical protein